MWYFVTDVALLLPFQWSRSFGTTTSGLWKPDMAAIFHAKHFFFYASLFKDVWPCECSYCALRWNGRGFLTFFLFNAHMHIPCILFIWYSNAKCCFFVLWKKCKNKSFWRINIFGFLECFRPILLNWAREQYAMTLSHKHAFWNAYPKQLVLY